MDRTYQYAQSGNQQPPIYDGSNMQTPYIANRQPTSSGLHGPPPPDHSLLPWEPTPPAHDGYSYDSPGAAGPGGPRYALPYGFDYSIPPPPFSYPPPGPLSMAPPQMNAYRSSRPPSSQTFSQPFRAGPQPPRYDFEPGRDRSLAKTQPGDERALQRMQDTQWLRGFLQNRSKKSRVPKTQQQQQTRLSSVPPVRKTLYRLSQLVSLMEESCESLKHNLHDVTVWSESYSTTLNVMKEICDEGKLLSDDQCLDQLKADASRFARRRALRERARKKLQMEEQQAKDRRSVKEAAIDKWMMKQIQQVEDKKKERELKLAADSVLCEVRKKQADMKRMEDVLKSLEKLRRLRKEAASRKGIDTEQQFNQVFSSRLEHMGYVIKKRMAVYSAEEKALMVMLEGEQEEERRRERERRMKKEKERHLHRKHRVNSMLFGEELPRDSVLQPFIQYYSQAEHSLHALIQIRREWDMFVVSADHPDGSFIPQNWILPAPPSDQAWASAVQTESDHDGP
ncbi:programmed cell death protein 7 [Mugil cephalus]|uniref:programmed cell death protein 7 n=1 Tax=Mugil cephalus TaxID=48193 RepID=UPI001FB5C2A3|nr:programmed cell death protein 7 [Mugil cephalus]